MKITSLKNEQGQNFFSFVALPVDHKSDASKQVEDLTSKDTNASVKLSIEIFSGEIKVVVSLKNELEYREKSKMIEILGNFRLSRLQRYKTNNDFSIKPSSQQEGFQLEQMKPVLTEENHLDE